MKSPSSRDLLFLLHILSYHWVMSHGSFDKAGTPVRTTTSYYMFLRLCVFLRPQLPHKQAVDTLCSQPNSPVVYSLCYQFLFGPSLDCDPVTLKRTSEIPSYILLEHCTMPPSENTSPQALTCSQYPHLLGWVHSFGGSRLWTLAWCATPPSSRTCE